MQKIPECRSMNFSIYEGMLNRYKDSEDIRKSYESRGLNGLEVIRAGEPDEGKILPDNDWTWDDFCPEIVIKPFSFSSSFN